MHLRLGSLSPRGGQQLLSATASMSNGLSARHKTILMVAIPLVIFTLAPLYYLTHHTAISLPLLSPSLSLSRSLATDRGDTSDMKTKRDAVRTEFLHCWNAYKQHAWGADELKPLSAGRHEWLGIGTTILDSLSTMYIMELKNEFADARQWIASSLNFDNPFTKSNHVSLFETTIRGLGGLLSAYALSNDTLFLDKAKDLGDRLLRAFPGGGPIPCGAVPIHDQEGLFEPKARCGSDNNLAEAGTLQLEFIYLAIATKDTKYALPVANIIDVLDQQEKKNGLYPHMVGKQGDLHHGARVMLGGREDSFFEYLLKMWLFTAQMIPKYARMYGDAERAIFKHMIVKQGDLVYAAELQSDVMPAKIARMEHLACFAGGMFGLASAKGVRGSAESQTEELQMGEGITETCYKSYKITRTGLGPEAMSFVNPGAGNGGISVQVPENILRPETVESLFVLWRVTHEQKYRDWGWEIFLAFKEHTRVARGYTGLRDVNNPANKHDLQQSFFMAETLKYLYLLFSPDDVISLDKWVFNTEAHPLPIMDPTRVNDWLPYTGSTHYD